MRVLGKLPVLRSGWRWCAGGTVAGSFYRVLVDREAAGLWRTVRLAAALYTLTSCVQGVTRWLSELVAARHFLQLCCDH